MARNIFMAMPTVLTLCFMIPLSMVLQVIPDFPTLKHREKQEVALPYFVRNLEDKHMKEEDGQVTVEAEFSIPDPRKVRYRQTLGYK